MKTDALRQALEMALTLGRIPTARDYGQAPGRKALPTSFTARRLAEMGKVQAAPAPVSQPAVAYLCGGCGNVIPAAVSLSALYAHKFGCANRAAMFKQAKATAPDLLERKLREFLAAQEPPRTLAEFEGAIDEMYDRAKRNAIHNAIHAETDNDHTRKVRAQFPGQYVMDEGEPSEMDGE